MAAEIDKLIYLTEQMLCLAIVGEWEELALREAERIAIIKSQPTFSDDTNSDVTAKLNELIEKNAQILALAMAEKDKIAEELRHSRKQEKADLAYRNLNPD